MARILVSRVIRESRNTFLIIKHGTLEQDPEETLIRFLFSFVQIKTKIEDQLTTIIKEIKGINLQGRDCSGT